MFHLDKRGRIFIPKDAINGRYAGRGNSGCVNSFSVVAYAADNQGVNHGLWQLNNFSVCWCSRVNNRRVRERPVFFGKKIPLLTTIWRPMCEFGARKPTEDSLRKALRRTEIMSSLRNSQPATFFGSPLIVLALRNSNISHPYKRQDSVGTRNVNSQISYRPIALLRCISDRLFCGNLCSSRQRAAVLASFC